MFTSIFSRIAIIFIVLLVGAVARWRKVLTPETTDGLYRLALEVTLPSLFFYTLSTSLTRKLFYSIWPLPLLAMALILSSYFISWLILLHLKLNPGQRRTFLFLATFPNYGFLAIPLIYALFGEAGLVRIIMFNLGITFLYWTLGIAILTGRGSNKLFKNLLNKATIALVLGLTVGLSGFPLPEFILEAARLIGNATIPLALLVVGSILAQPETRKAISFKTLSTLVFCRLMLMPTLALLFLSIFDDLPALLRVLIVLQAAMPSASTSPLLARRFGADVQLAASGVFFTTLLSMVTVPLFVSVALR